MWQTKLYLQHPSHLFLMYKCFFRAHSIVRVPYVQFVQASRSLNILRTERHAQLQ